MYGQTDGQTTMMPIADNTDNTIIRSAKSMIKFIYVVLPTDKQATEAKT